MLLIDATVNGNVPDVLIKDIQLQNGRAYQHSIYTRRLLQHDVNTDGMHTDLIILHGQMLEKFRGRSIYQLHMSDLVIDACFTPASGRGKSRQIKFLDTGAYRLTYRSLPTGELRTCGIGEFLAWAGPNTSNLWNSALGK